MNGQAPHPHDEQRMRSRTEPPQMSSSGRVTPALVALLCLGLLIASYERGHGHFHQISEAVGSAPPPTATGPNAPGGQDAIRLTRTAASIGSQPEFLSTTLLPGRGLEVLQITASIPGHGEVPLLVAPTLPEALDEWTDAGVDAHGSLGARSGAAFLLPWAGQLTGHSGSQPGTLETTWQGLNLTVPTIADGASQSTEGLILDRGVENVKTSVLADGQALEATLHGGNFHGAWISNIDINYHIELTGHAVELTVRATNVGTEPAPIGIGWKPHFAIPSGDRAAALLTIPSATISTADPHSGAPTGHTAPAAGTGFDFERPAGTALGSRDVDATYTDLVRGAALGPVSVLRDPGFNIALRLIPLTPEISRIHVEAPNGKPWVVLEADTNADDPTGAQWQGQQTGGLLTLAPGASLVWKVRLEISSLSTPEPIAVPTPSHLSH